MGRAIALNPEEASGPAPRRSCVSCRTRRAPSELVRLVLVSRHRLEPDLRRALPGRGAWVCPTAACLGRLEGHSRLLGRALRRDPGQGAVEGLTDRLKEAIQVEIPPLLRGASRSGRVRSGAVEVQRAGSSVRALIRATDASTRSVEEAHASAEVAVLAEIGLDRLALGGLVGRGPRAVLAVCGGTPEDVLVSRLRWLGALG